MRLFILLIIMDVLLTGTVFADLNSFRNGVDDYHSQIDLGLFNFDRNDGYATGGIRTDGTLGIDGNAVSQSVLRFEGIIGSGSNRIAPGSTIHSATLTLYTRGATSTDPGSAGKISAYRLTTFWDTNSDWRTFNSGNWGGNDGVTDDGVLVSTRTSGVSNSNHAPNDIDLTVAVQSWADGEFNYGIGLAYPHTNAADLASGDEGRIAEAYRPLLTVEYAIPELSTLSILTAYAMALFLWRKTLSKKI